MRNSVDAFLHKSNFDCLRRKKKEEEEEKEVMEGGLVGGIGRFERREKGLAAMKRKGKDEVRKVGEKRVRREKNKKDKKRKRVGHSERCFAPSLFPLFEILTVFSSSDGFVG